MAIKLPERNYFTFPEVMARWQCTENDVRHVIIDGTLKPSYFIGKNIQYSELVGRDDGSFEAMPVCDEIRFYNQGIYFLQPGERTNPFDCDFGIFTSSRESTKLMDGKVSGFYILEEALPFAEVLENGVVTMEELAFFERKFSGQSEKQSLTEKISERERTTLLNIVGGLLGLMLTTTKGGQKGSPYTSQSAIIEALLVHYDGKPGIKNSTLEQKFSDAKRSINAT